MAFDEASDADEDSEEIAHKRHRAFEGLRGGNATLWSEVTADT